MVWYKKRTIVGNTLCLRSLYQFREQLVRYFNNVEYDSLTDLRENSEARDSRTQINRTVNIVHAIILRSGVSTNLRYTPPAMIGGYIQDIDLVANVFNLSRYMIEPNNLLDVVDRSIGQYENDRLGSLFRTINPFFWLGRSIDFLVAIPFRLFSKVGISTKNFEESSAGKISKLVLYVVTLAASLLTILQILGYSDSFRLFLKDLVSN